MNHRAVIVLCVGAALAAFALRSKLIEDPDVPATDEVNRLERRMAELERSQRFGGLRATVAATLPAPHHAAPGEPGIDEPSSDEHADDNGDASRPLDGAALVEQQLAADEAHFDHLENELVGEPVDPAWADEITQTLSRSFHDAQLDVVGRIAQVDCRQSRCAIDLERSAARPETSRRLGTQQVVQWLMQQSCAFQVEGDALRDDAAQRQRIYLDCEARRGTG